MPHRGAVNRGPASLQGWVIVVASFHKLQLIVVHVWPTNALHMLVHQPWLMGAWCGWVGQGLGWWPNPDA